MDNFNGDYDSWPTFRDQFSALYGHQSHIPEVEKLCHLLKKTKGEAHDIVRSCPFTNAGFQMAWDNLVDRYENNRVLINAQLKVLFGLTHIAKESGPSIKTLQRTINNCVTNLALLQIDTDNWDVIFVYICSTCLPDLTLNLWEQSLRNSVELPTWKDMDAFLTSRFHTLESVSDIRSSLPSQSVNTIRKNQNFKANHSRDSRQVNSYHTNVSSAQNKNCTLCKDSHPLRLCPLFLHMSVEERFATVKNQKRCTNCLATSHDFKNCKSHYVCFICKQKHHSLLHRSSTSTSSSPSNSQSTPTTSHNSSEGSLQTNNSPPVLQQPSTSAEAARTRQSYSTKIQSTHPKLTILGTALVNIKIGDIIYKVRALIDPASEASFISKSLQSKLSLPSQSSQTNIVGLSGSVAAASTQICSIQIGSSLEPTFTTSVDVFVVKKLTGQLPYHPFSSSISSIFSDLPMADTFHSSSHVDLLLGGEVYPQIIRNGVRWNSDRTLVPHKAYSVGSLQAKPILPRRIHL